MWFAVAKAIGIEPGEDGLSDIILALSPIRYFRLGDNGSIIKDETGNVNAKMYGTNYTQNINSLAVCNQDNAIDMIGSTQKDYIDCGVLPIGNVISASFFIRFNYEFNIQYFFGNMSGEQDRRTGSFNLGFLGGNGPNYWQTSIGDGTTYWNIPDTIFDSYWDEVYHIYFCVNGTSVKLYVNGKLILDTISTIDLADSVRTNNFTIGKPSTNSVDYRYAGSIDEFAIFDKELTIQEIQDIYNSSLVCTNLPTVDYKTYAESLGALSFWGLDEPAFDVATNKAYDPTVVSTSLALSNNDRTIVSTTDGVWRNAYSESVLIYNYIQYVEFVIDNNISTKEYMFGFTTRSATLDTTDFISASYDGFGLYHKSDDTVVLKQISNIPKETPIIMSTLVSGDIVGLTLNYSKLILEIYLNGVFSESIDLLALYNFTPSSFFLLGSSILETGTQITMLPLESEQNYPAPTGSESWGDKFPVTTFVDSISGYDSEVQNLRFGITGVPALTYGEGKALDTQHGNTSLTYSSIPYDPIFNDTAAGVTAIGSHRVIDSSTNGLILGKYLGNWGIGITNNKIYFEAGGSYITQYFNRIVGRTYHIAGVHAVNGDLRLYIDGDLVISSNDTDRINHTYGIGLASNGYNGANSVRGVIDDIMFFNKEISSSEIKELYNIASIGQDTPIINNYSDYVRTLNLVSYWRMDDLIGQTELRDTKLNEVMVLQGVPNMEMPSMVFGSQNTCIDFTVDHTYIDTNESFGLNLGDFTISFICKTTSSDLDNNMIFDLRQGINHSIHFTTGTGSDIGKLRYVTPSQAQIGNTRIDDTNIHVIVITRLSGTTSIYIDGTLDMTFVDDVDLGYIAGRWWICSNSYIPTVHDFPAFMQEFFFARQGITQAQVTDLYLLTIDPNTSTDIQEFELITDRFLFTSKYCADCCVNSDNTKLFLFDQGRKVIMLPISADYNFNRNENVFEESAQVTEMTAGQGRSIALSIDGTKIFLNSSGATERTRVYQYTMSTPFDISTISYDSVFYELASSNIDCISFSNDGLFMFVGNGYNLRKVILDTAWDLSSYTDNDFIDVPNVFDITGFDFSADGTKYYQCHYGDIIYEYDVSPAYDINGLTFVQSYSFGKSPTKYLSGISISDDGSYIYIANQTGGDGSIILNLSTPFDVSTITYSSNEFKRVNGSDKYYISSDGMTMNSIIISSPTIRVYDFTIPWDLYSIPDPNIVTSITIPDTGSNSNKGIFPKPDGTKLYIGSSDLVQVNQFSFGTNWDLNTLSLDVAVLDLTISGFSVISHESIYFSPDGSKLVLIGVFDSNRGSLQFSTSTPWDISSYAYDGILLHPEFTTIAPDGPQNGQYGLFSLTGDRYYAMTRYGIYQYTLSTNYDITTGVYGGVLYMGLSYSWLNAENLLEQMWPIDIDKGYFITSGIPSYTQVLEHAEKV